MTSIKGVAIAKKEVNPGNYILILVKAIPIMKAGNNKRYNKRSD